MTTVPSDLAVGSFSESAPWTLDDPASLPWRAGLDAVRRRAHDEVPALTRPTRVPPVLRAVRVARHLGLAVAGWRLRERSDDQSTSRSALSHRLRVAAEALGPTYIKLAQIISSGEGIFPAELVDEFKYCRDRVPPEPFTSVRKVVEEDLGRPLGDVFASFDEAPLAAASIAQVHAATLVTGEAVVVKVQRPSVARLVREDLKVMAWLAPHLVGRIPIAALANPPALVELFAETIVEELDFRLEAENMLDVAAVFRRLGQDHYVVPRPHPTLVTRRVLIMERLDGFAFDDVAGMKEAGVDTEAVVRAGMIASLEGAILEGVFHGDLHGGNLFIRPDGRTALLDFGITGRLEDTRRVALLRLLMGGAGNDVRAQVAAIRDLGALPADVDVDRVVAELGLDQPPVDPTQLSGDELVGELQRVVKGLLGLGAKFPKELMLFVKNLVFLDGAITRLAPDLDLLGQIAEVSLYFATTHGDRIMADVGVDPRTIEVDLDGARAAMGITDGSGTITHRELRDRRQAIRDTMSQRRRSRRSR